MYINNINKAHELSKLINSGTWIILYYAEYCPYCRDFKPEWDKFDNFVQKGPQSRRISFK